MKTGFLDLRRKFVFLFLEFCVRITESKKLEQQSIVLKKKMQRKLAKQPWFAMYTKGLIWCAMKILASASVKQLHKNYSHLVNRSIANSSRGKNCKLQSWNPSKYKVMGKSPFTRIWIFALKNWKISIYFIFLVLSFALIFAKLLVWQFKEQLQLAEFCKLLYAVPRKD